MPKLKIKGRVFTQNQYMMLLSCDPHRNAIGIPGNSKVVIKYLLNEELIKELQYDNSSIYYQPTAKGKEYL